MKFHILTLFPEMIIRGLEPSIIGRATEKNLISLNAVNIRDYTEDKHGKVDDYPYGGGAGMLMQAQPVFDAHKAVTEGRKVRTIYVTPQGTPFTQKHARELASEEELVFLCGHYEGVDRRIIDEIVDMEISIGDFVLTGGEIPACILVDCVARLADGVLAAPECYEEESISSGLLEYPQYTRPYEFHGVSVPDVLISGHHENIEKWRREKAIELTKERRPDLYSEYERSVSNETTRSKKTSRGTK